jgi:hypothetical protein
MAKAKKPTKNQQALIEVHEGLTGKTTDLDGVQSIVLTEKAVKKLRDTLAQVITSL